MGIFGLVLTYLSRNEEAKWLARWRKRLRPLGNGVRRLADRVMPKGAAQVDQDQVVLNPKPPRIQDAVVLTIIAIVYFVLVFEHELSPYVVAIQLAGLAVIGAIRYRWIVVLLVVMVLAYLAPHFAFVNSQYGLTKSIGDFFGNVAPPKATVANASVTAGVRLSERASGCFPWRCGRWQPSAHGGGGEADGPRRSRYSYLLPVLVLLAGAYGNEGILRVYLFSLPWTACLAASALKPVSSVRSNLELSGHPQLSR